jgi:hypothetical protein
MKSRTLTCITAMTLFSTLAISVPCQFLDLATIHSQNSDAASLSNFQPVRNQVGTLSTPDSPSRTANPLICERKNKRDL